MTKNGKRAWQILSSVTLVGLMSSVAQAGTISLITSPFVATDSLTLPALGTCVGQYVGFQTTCPTIANNNPAVDPINSVNSNPLTFDFSVTNGEVWQQSTASSSFDFDGQFTNGEALLATVVGGTTLTINFGTDISAFGVSIQETDYTNSLFTASINVNGGTACANFTTACTESSTSTSSAPLFIGVSDAGGALINSITITTSSLGAGSGNFLLGGMIFTESSTGNPPPPQTPEPSTFVMIGGGLVALGLKARKHIKA
jgi:PEP-CTERM motif